MSRVKGFLTLYILSGGPLVVVIYMDTEKELGQEIERAMHNRTEFRMIYVDKPDTTCLLMHGTMIVGYRIGTVPGWEAPPKVDHTPKPPSKDPADWWRDGGPNPFNTDGQVEE